MPYTIPKEYCECVGSNNFCYQKWYFTCFLTFHLAVWYNVLCLTMDHSVTHSFNCLIVRSVYTMRRLRNIRMVDSVTTLTHWGRDKMAAVSQTTFSNAFSWMKMIEFRLRFYWSLFPRVQLIIFQHWFRWWLGAGQATSHYLNQWWLVYWRIYTSLGLNELTKLVPNDISFPVCETLWQFPCLLDW